AGASDYNRSTVPLEGVEGARLELQSARRRVGSARAFGQRLESRWHGVVGWRRHGIEPGLSEFDAAARFGRVLHERRVIGLALHVVLDVGERELTNVERFSHADLVERYVDVYRRFQPDDRVQAVVPARVVVVDVEVGLEVVLVYEEGGRGAGRGGEGGADERLPAALPAAQLEGC